MVDASQGYVVGILGPWGSGKTSLVRDVLQLYLERVAGESLSAFHVAERALALANDEGLLDAYLRTVSPDRLENVIAAFEVYEGEYPPESIVPLCTVLLNILPSIPNRPRGMMDFMVPRIVVARVVLRALRQHRSREAIEAAVDAILPKLDHLTSRAEPGLLRSRLRGS